MPKASRSKASTTHARKDKLDKAKIKRFRIPQSREEWQDMYAMSNLNNRCIHSIDVMESASKCTDVQYVALRSIAPNTKTPKWLLKNLAKFELVEAKQEADELLSKSTEFQRFIQLVAQNKSIQSLSGEEDACWPGSWAAARQLQEQLLWESNPPRSQNRDECVVNAGLVIFLETVGNLYLRKGARKCRWALDQVDVGATFHKGPEWSYTAKVDGVLLSTTEDHIKAIIEVKRARQDKSYEATLKEETCQVAGFLKTTRDCHLPLNGARLQVAEYDDEVFTNFASWTAEYLEYIRSSRRKRMDTVPAKAWLTMQQVWDATEMRDLVSIVLAMLIKANTAN